MKRKISILALLISISLFSYSQKIDFNFGFSNLIGTSSPHASYGFLSDLGIRITKKSFLYSGIEVNNIKYTQNGIVYTDPYGFTGDYAIDHTYTFYGIPVFLTHKVYSLGSLNIKGRVGIQNTFLCDYYSGSPTSEGFYGNGTKKKG